MHHFLCVRNQNAPLGGMLLAHIFFFVSCCLFAIINTCHMSAMKYEGLTIPNNYDLIVASYLCIIPHQSKSYKSRQKWSPSNPLCLDNLLGLLKSLISQRPALTTSLLPNRLSIDTLGDVKVFPATPESTS